MAGRPQPSREFAPALDGEAGRELRRLIDLEVRRDYGAFFTGSAFAEKLAALAPKSSYYDPSCGAGDLLLAAARRLPVLATLRATVALWSRWLGGCDLHSEFVRATKARLVLLARSRGVFVETLSPKHLKSAFPKIKVGDALAAGIQPLRGATILMNPPYFSVTMPAGCTWWGHGNVNIAAVFVQTFLARAPAGTDLLAILPEVLRSGSSYTHWRTSLAQATSELEVKSWGIFDANADVDVFMLKVRKKADDKTPAAKWPIARAKRAPLGNTFDVSVGAVVPHRHRRIGILRRYLDARSAPCGGTVQRVKVRRKFKGKVVKPPFVVVKRTSRPGDKFRAAPTVVMGTQPVAVENHLIVCQPKDGKIVTCTTLAKRLRSDAVNRSLNRTIRCRHLTVGAVRTIDLANG